MTWNSKMEMLREVTKWDCDAQPNHDYMINNGGRLVAYRKNGEGDWVYFSKPLTFNRGRRKFQKLK